MSALKKIITTIMMEDVLGLKLFCFYDLCCITYAVTPHGLIQPGALLINYVKPGFL